MKSISKSILCMLALLLFGVVLSSSIIPPGPEAYGYRVFLSNPESYTYKCGCGIGSVTSASVDGNQMTITYTMPCASGMVNGTMKGSYDSYHNRFTGTYTSNQGLWTGNISFGFNASGEARGSWSSESTGGTMEMLAK